jgi:hypothetical protein
MTSAYRRDHEPSPLWDEYERLAVSGRTAIAAAVVSFEALYPAPAASEAELRALRRAFARFLIDSGKASEEGLV